jgi:hypothetical protein
MLGNTQSVLEGQVIDPEGEPLAFVSILLKTDHDVVLFSDIDGRFKHQLKAPCSSITLRYVGFDEKTIQNPDTRHPITIILQPSHLILDAIDIIAGENPADRLMKRAVANRHLNNPERSKSYSCKTYSKMTIDLLPNASALEKRNQKEENQKEILKMEAMMKQQHLLIMESVTERNFLNPNLLQEKVLHNRISGLKNAELVALANSIQPFSLYGDFLPIMGKKFITPLSPGSTKLYFFNLEDTIYHHQDTIWVISFKPKKGKVFVGLKGVLHLNSRQYAIQHVLASPAFGTENLDMKIEQAYTYIESSTLSEKGRWFPLQLNFELTAAKYPAPEMGIKLAGHSYISQVNTRPNLKPKDFNRDQPIVLIQQGDPRDSTVWVPWRTHEPLSIKGKNTYLKVDSLGDALRLDRWSKALNALSSGIWPIIDPVGIRLNRILQLNEYEGMRIGAEFTNAQAKPLRLQRKLEWGTGLGYGYLDKRIKYNAYGLWRINRNRQTQLQLAYRSDIEEPGAVYELGNNAILNRRLYAKRMDNLDEVLVQFSSRIQKSFTAGILARKQTLGPAGYDYSFQVSENQLVNQFSFLETTIQTRFAWGETSRSFLGNPVSINRLPVVEFASTLGKWEGGNYNRFLISAYQSQFIQKIGYLQWRLEAGKALGALPIAKLFSQNQIGESFNGINVAQTFQALPDTFFLHDQFLNLFIAQEVGPILYQRTYSAPFLTLLYNLAAGTLSNPQKHTQLKFTSMQKPYHEGGIKIDNILRLNYLDLGWIGVGVAAYYRFGFWSSPDWRQNVVFRLSTKLTL